MFVLLFYSNYLFYSRLGFKHHFFISLYEVSCIKHNSFSYPIMYSGAQTGACQEQPSLALATSARQQASCILMTYFKH